MATFDPTKFGATPVNNAFNPSQFGATPVTSQDATAQPPEFLADHPVLKGISDMIGTTGLGKGLAQAIFLKFTPEGRELASKGSYQDLTNVIGAPATTKEIFGSAAQTALSFAAMGKSPIPASPLLTKTPIGRIASGAIAGGTFGGLSAGINKFSSGGSTQDIIKNSLIGGTIGAITGGTLSAVSEGISAGSKAIYNRTIKPTLDEARKSIKYNGQTVGDKLLDKWVVKTDRGLLNTAVETINTNEDKLQTILSESDKTLNRSDVSKYLDEIIKTKESTPGLAEDVAKVKAVLNEFPEQVSVAQANEIKRNIYAALRDTAFKIDPNLSTKREAMKVLAGGIKTEIENAVGGDTVKTLNRTIGDSIVISDRITDKMAKAISQKPNVLNQLIQLGAGAGVGATLAGVPGAIGGAVVEKVASSPIAQRGAAVLGKKIVSPLIQKAIPAITAGEGKLIP